MVRKIVLFFGILVFCSIAIVSQTIEAITSDGKTVNLFEDGTWEYSDKVDTVGNFDLRKVNWNMTIDQVRSSETLDWEVGEIDDNTSYLAAETKFLDNEAILAYYFNLNRLYKVRYIITKSHSNKTDYWFDYKTYLEAISEKYGSPSSEYDGMPIWKDDLYKDDPSDWGMAIAIGDMLACAIWETDRTQISALIQGDNYKISTVIDFDSKNFEVIEVEKIQQF
jgi:hypothetical protein